MTPFWIGRRVFEAKQCRDVGPCELLKFSDDLLHSCEKLFCNQSKDQSTRNAVKSLDDVFTRFRTELNTLESLIQQYGELWLKVPSNCVNCPELEAFRDTGSNVRRIYETLSAVERGYDQHKDAHSNVLRVESDLMCFDQIKDTMSELSKKKQAAGERFRTTSARAKKP